MKKEVSFGKSSQNRSESPSKRQHLSVEVYDILNLKRVLEEYGDNSDLVIRSTSDIAAEGNSTPITK
ncbi:hypothetical protein PanWU01x14_309840 [Parasponia andersonii]|uniref:Uncharacterized protein n=1 Tax=Parasponia andersonii TaxID=3476 RepID=A0A2P5AQP1_PARAD|nr:hypothetical protein PanWU01x14_309840 [Parasponia andersonii]